MALVTVQRSPNSVTESPSECSKADGEVEDDESSGKNEKSECFFAGKGTALLLALKDIPPHQRAERRLSTDSNRSTNSTQSNNSDIHQHLPSMFYLLRHEETLKMAVKLESQRPNRTRYLVIASRSCYRSAAGTSERRTKIARHNSAKAPTLAAGNANASAAPAAARQASMDSHLHRAQQQSQNNTNNNNSCAAEGNVPTELLQEKPLSANRQNLKCDADKNTASAAGDGKCADNGIDESCLLGIDCNERTTIGLVVPILADTTIHLDGDGGFSVSVFGKTHIFKPVSVQAMWSALQTLHKVSKKARENNFYPGGPSHDWLAHYESRIESEQSCLNEWNAMDSLESRRPPSPDAIRNKPTAKEETEVVIKMKLKEIMMSVDLDEVTSKYIRGRLEEHLDMDLGEYKSFIDEEMLTILGQMDAPTEIFEHVYLGSEWNASNLEELQKNGVRHILNVTREIDNFFPGMFDYFNVRVYDDEKTNLLKHWDNTFRYITRAKADGSKVLVHCKMGVSRSASVVIAYAMKAYNWEFEEALQHVKARRNCIKPNKNFLNQLETYRGMLDAMKNKEKLQRSKSETNLKCTKDARLLPGSEPTPLIQALNQSKSQSAGHGVSGDGIETPAGMEIVHAINCRMNAAAAAAAAHLMTDGASAMTMTMTTISSEPKHRRIVRRSSSTSPKSLHGGHAAIVMKQQSQSLENLTPERSIADEPKNVRYPGSNGENYSVTQNQVLHIQKNTPPPPPPPLPPPPPVAPLTAAILLAGVAVGYAPLPPPPTSVRTIVHDLEAHKEGARKTADDRKTLNLLFGNSLTHDTGGAVAPDTGRSSDESEPMRDGGSNLGSPVWTSSAKLITQTFHLPAGMAAATGTQQQYDMDGVTIGTLRRSVRSRRNTGGSVCSVSSSCDVGDVFSAQLDNVFAKEEEKKQQHSHPHHHYHSRKTQSWAATGGGIVMDAPKLGGSNSSIDSASSNATSKSLTGSVPPYEGGGSFVRTRPRQREQPSRHASWGSGDNRGVAAVRKGSWGSYDTNRNNFQYGGATAATAIFEGKIHELNHMSNKTATSNNTNNTNTANDSTTPAEPQHVGTVKRTKQKLQERTALKKLCQENGTDDEHAGLPPCSGSPPQRGSNLYRSASAAGSMRPARFAQRCNSDDATTSALLLQQRNAARRSDGSKPLNVQDLFPLAAAVATTSYTKSDIENKNTLPPAMADDGDSSIGADADDDDAAVAGSVLVELRFPPPAAGSAEEQRISGNVQILKKNFEAKAVATSATAAVATPPSAQPLSQQQQQSIAAAVGGRKGHQSLPSSPVAQHVEHVMVAAGAASDGAEQSAAKATLSGVPGTTTASSSSASVSSSASPLSSSASEASGGGASDHNVKCLVHKYQTTSSSSTTNTATASNLTASATTIVASSAKPRRPHSYYESTRPIHNNSKAVGTAKASPSPPLPHDYSDSRPPPAPSKLAASGAMTDSILMQQHQQQQQQQQQQITQPRRLQQHGRTHPLTKLSLPNQSFNAAAYNTM